jgi:glucose-1-phosphate adenylyltransferase
MDYGTMIARHVESKADMTVGCIEVPLEGARAFGVISVNEEGQVVKFDEKPDKPDSIPGQPGMALASMGIYVFNTNFLYEQLIKDADDTYSTHDFGHDIIPRLIKKYRIMTYPFRDTHDNQAAYWRDVGTIDSFWAANLELIGVLPELNLYDDKWPIWTYQEQLPPAKFIFDDDERRGMALDSMVSGGCVISGATVRHSLLFSNVRVNSYSELQDVVALPNVSFGRDCRITRAVIDKGCELPDGTIIGADAEADAKRFYVSPGGVVLVTPEMLGQEIHHVR